MFKVLIIATSDFFLLGPQDVLSTYTVHGNSIDLDTLIVPEPNLLKSVDASVSAVVLNLGPLRTDDELDSWLKKLSEKVKQPTVWTLFDDLELRIEQRKPDGLVVYGAFRDDMENDDYPSDLRSCLTNALLHRMQENSARIRRGVLAHREPIRYLSQAILELLTEERERIRGSNGLLEDQKNELVKSVDRLEHLLASLEGIIPENEKAVDDEVIGRLTEWNTRFRKAINKNIEAVVDPENMANAAVPTAIILSCGALGAMVGGPVGFGAGSVFGHLITGQLKPGAVAKRIEDAVEIKSNDGGPDA